MADWDDEPHTFRTSVLGRVDWSCWLAVVGLLFVTVISFMVQFPAMGIVTAIIAVLLVVFDSWVNRPTGRRAVARSEHTGTGWRTGTGWSDIRRADSRPQQPVRQPPPARPAANRPAPGFRGQQGQGQAPRPNQPPQRTQVQGRPNAAQQPPIRPTQGQPPRPNQQPQPQPTRVNQAQPPQRAPYRPGPPQPPTRGREPDYRART